MVHILETLRAIWQEANRPDSFMGRSYDLFVNCFLHAAIGVFLAAQISLGWSLITGEMPARLAVLFLIVVGYFVFIEWFRQGYKGWDSVADAIYVAIGALVTLYTFKEVRVCGKYLLEPNPSAAVALLSALPVVILLHVAVMRIQVAQQQGRD
jgi:hypothetical protein